MYINKIKELNKHLKGTVWQNRKHKGFYTIDGIVCDTTNERNGNKTVLFSSLTNSNLPQFVRDYYEFAIKFKKVD